MLKQAHSILSGDAKLHALFLVLTMAMSWMNLAGRQMVKVAVLLGTGLNQGAVKVTGHKGGNLTTGKAPS